MWVAAHLRTDNLESAGQGAGMYTSVHAAKVAQVVANF
jgi:hypothetical protein